MPAGRLEIVARRPLTRLEALLQEAGEGAFAGFRLRVLERTPSTQDVVRAAARGGAEAGFCCMAREQSAGRGRQGRVWVAPPGSGLLVSVLVRVPAAVAGGVPLVGGVAVVEAVEGLGVAAGVVGLKWPNDVMVGGEKLAGVLAEVEAAARPRGGTPRAGVVPAPPISAGGRAIPFSSDHGKTVAVVLGVGLNLGPDPAPPGVPATNLHTLLARDVPWQEALAPLLTALGARLRELESGGIPATVRAWRQHALGLGAPIEAHTPNGVIRGTAVDLADDGALLVETPQGLTRLLAGDVHLAPPPRPSSPS